jgi:hypothetical protein
MLLRFHALANFADVESAVSILQIAVDRTDENS